MTPQKSANPSSAEYNLGLPDHNIAFNFAADGRLYFYDKPDQATGPATFTISPSRSASGVQILTHDFGNFTPDLAIVAVPLPIHGITQLKRVRDNSIIATLNNRASPVIFSPDQTKLAYLLRSLNQDGPEQPQRFTLWSGDIDGSNMQKIWTLLEGASLAWFADNRRLLLTARDQANNRFGVWVIDTTASPEESATLIIESKGINDARLSRDGRYIVYAVTYQGDDASGVWLSDCDGSNRRKFAREGGWRWSTLQNDRFFYLPVGGLLSTFQIDTGRAAILTDTPLPVSGNQWLISPDDQNVVYRHKNDNALWLRSLIYTDVNTVVLFNDAAFSRVWQRIDKPVSDAQAGRGYTWGPPVDGTVNIIKEPYDNGTRLVQYFDKARMEINDPTGDPHNLFYVTTGLLVKELVTGYRQDGPATFSARRSSTVQVAGDPNDNGANPGAPTYKSFLNVGTFFLHEHREVDLTGQNIVKQIDHEGNITTFDPPAQHQLQFYDEVSGHNIADVFAEFRNRRGLIWNGKDYIEGAIFTSNPTYVLGRPVTEPYWCRATVGGSERDILVQLFERRSLTYTPANPLPFRVEMGNVGQHYYKWRYQTV